MWTHGTGRPISETRMAARRAVGAQWQHLPTRTADPGRRMRGRRRAPPIAAASQHTVLRVKSPADVLGKQVDAVFGFDQAER
jgi:hypothetical protein